MASMLDVVCARSRGEGGDGRELRESLDEVDATLRGVLSMKAQSGLVFVSSGINAQDL